MDVLDFLARSEWPLVAAGALFLLRQPLKAMLDQVSPTKIDAWGLKAEFERRLSAAEALVPPVADAKAKVGDAADKGPVMAFDAMPTPLKPRRLRSLALGNSFNPRTAIYVAWRQLERALEQFPGAKEQAPDQRMLGILNMAEDIGLTEEEVIALTELQKMANAAIHAKEDVFSRDDALRFRSLAARLRWRLRDEAQKRSK